MTLPPILAQIDVPIDQMLQAQIGTLALVLAIVMVISAAAVAVPLIWLLYRVVNATQDAQRKAEAALTQAQAAQATLSTSALALATSMDTNTSELRKQTGVLTDLPAAIGKRIDDSGKATVDAVTGRIDASDAEHRASNEEIKALLLEMREEWRKGHKSHHGEVIGKLDLMIGLLTPPPPPLAVLKPPELVEKKVDAA